MSKEFDFDKALKALQSGKAITGKDGVLTPLIKQLTEAALEAELDSHLADEVTPNRKNGTTSKTVKSTAGPFELDTPRDRSGTFEPQLVKKHQRRSTSMDDKILFLYAQGMSTREIVTTFKEMYGADVSGALISKVTDAVLEQVVEWQSRPLSEPWRQRHPDRLCRWPEGLS